MGNLLWWCIVGLIAGFLAGKVMKGGGFGVLMDIVIGIVGAMIGGWLFGLVGIYRRRRTDRLDHRGLRRRLHSSLARAPDQESLAIGTLLTEFRGGLFGLWVMPLGMTLIQPS